MLHERKESKIEKVGPVIQCRHYNKNESIILIPWNSSILEF
jgi:hypothetical protein